MSPKRMLMLLGALAVMMPLAACSRDKAEEAPPGANTPTIPLQSAPPDKPKISPGGGPGSAMDSNTPKSGVVSGKARL